MSGRLSLAEQLASIRDDAPVEFDPENVDYGASTSAGRDLDAGRADYLQVGTSQLRKNLDTEAGPRYAGTKSSRKELFGNGDSLGQSDHEEDVEGESGDDDDEEEDDEGEEEEDEDSGEFDEDAEDSQDDEDDEEIPSDEDEGDMPTSANGKSRRSTATQNSNSHLDKDSRDMLQELKKASTADIEKGREVRKQLSFWDTLLEARIRLQKCVTSAHVLPEPSQLNTYAAESEDSHTQTKKSLEELSELLFSIRTQLHERNDKLQMSSATSKKRKRGSPEYLDNALEAASQMAELVNSHEHTIISKWSDKVSSATSALGSQNKFKALGPQNTLRQIESILSQDMERLVERSRIRRGASGKAIKVVGRDGAHEPVAGEKDASAEVFDDTDFYQALLRDVVDVGHGLGGAAGGPGSYANFNNVSRKKAAGVDPKASKGRKLRYHVHEKLQNFMAPIPMISWEKEQIDELFKGLLGGRGEFSSAVVEEAAAQDAAVIGGEAGQFRIF